MTRRVCTCAGTAPGYPQHESWCGQPEDDVCRCDDKDTLAPDCPIHGYLLDED